VSSCRALVTGASRGIGFMALEALASMGCFIVACSRSLDRMIEVSNEIFTRYPVRVIPFRCDLRVRDSVRDAVLYALEELLGLEYVVVNYGNPSREPLHLHEADWDDWMEASALYIASTATILRLLIERNPVKATVLITSSFTVAEPMPPLVVSDTVRAGLSRLVRIAAREYPDKVRPILLLLGSFDTPGARETVRRIAEPRGQDPEEVWRREVEGISPLRRTGRREELVELIRTLLRTPEYLTGATILFDGATSRIAWP
jgi:3-oxoacyl-[acyl-carrier protein] reductase